MDKYEFNIKTEQIKKLIRKKEYQKAAEIADTLDFTKIKNNALLITIADVYEVIGQYDSARDVLETAYERSQLGRQIAFRLARVSVKRRDLESATDYYEDFKAIAPKDASCYILQYEIAKLKNESVEKQIEILEKYVEDDMDDKWTYELAKLNHDAGNTDRCVELCDTIILWFSEGKYVDKAMELKMLHAPLTKSQQEKYNKRWEEQSEQINVEDIKLKEINVDNKYDTYNIQAEIAKSMVELFGESENEMQSENFYGDDDNDSFFKPVAEDKELQDTQMSESQKADEEGAARESRPADCESGVDDEKTKVIPSIAVVKELAKVAGLAKTVQPETGTQAEPNEVKVSNDENIKDDDDQIEGQITLDELLNGMYKPSEEESCIEALKEDNNEESKEMQNKEIEKENARELALDVLEEIEEKGEGNEEQEVTDEIKENEEEENTQSDTADARTLIRAFVEKYAGVEGLDKQVIRVLKNMLMNGGNGNDFVYIMGDVKSGKTTLAMEIIKLMSRVREKKTKKIAKVNGTSFTEKNVDTFASKLWECDVIIERASSIEPFVFSELIENLEKDEIKRVVVFEDERTLSEKYMVENKNIAQKIDNVIKLKHNKVKDWAKIAVDYAALKGYAIDEMGMLALHAKIDQLYAITLVIHKNHVEQLVDIAIENAERKTIGHLIRKLFGNKEKEKILTESDFIDD